MALIERLTDGGLEVWTTATDLTHWAEFDGGTVGEGIFRETVTVHGGTFSARLLTTIGGDYAGFQEDFTLTPGENCKLSLWYLRAAHASSELRLYIYDTGSNVSLKSDGTWQAGVLPIVFPVSAIWILYELAFIAHASYANYRIRFYKSHAAGGVISFYVDDVSLLEGEPEPPPEPPPEPIINKDLSSCVVVWDEKGENIKFNKTFGGVFFRYEELRVPIRSGQTGETHVDDVTIGTINPELEVPLTQEEIIALVHCFVNSALGIDSLRISNPIGADVFQDAKQIIVKPIRNGVISVESIEWLYIHRAFPHVTMEQTYDNSNQRTIKVIFKGFPDDVNGRQGEMWSFGPNE